ncbi:TnsA endonuclease N-terminal domain-containing protein [Neobacillus niacini]|uniref:TnsA endonuclease N-terminal domain-containing protein n=1 Tax=Neobacillus niacini TaxID=86668 RepID=UPI002864F105|nr:TnsA endonuclease N-terminal domain-containing protein [Neobacillus niacini]MDR7002818.1 DNA polymerase III alpha subunit [Neobacillus niacini]
MSKKGERIVKFQSNRIKNGYGQGTGENYKPFIQAHDNKVASDGWITRHKGWKTKRTHHTLSNHERNYLYYLEWLDEVVDIREQFPLFPMKRTEEIADQLGIKHAHYDNVPVVMTTDFVITLRTPNGLIDVVRTVKPGNKLDNRTLELFEIERRFFNEQGINWEIITECKLPKTLIKNVEWMCEARYLDTRSGIDEEVVDFINKPLFRNISKDEGETSISKICLRSDKEFGLESGSCMFILQYMLANKKWRTDMNIPIIESKPLKISSLEYQTKRSKEIG